MKQKYKLLCGAAILSCGVLTSSHKAHAQYATPADVWTSFAKSSVEGRTNTTNTIFTIGSALSQAYTGMTQSVLGQSGQETQNAAAQMKAQANMEDTKSQNEYQNKVAQATLEAMNQSTSGTTGCSDITGRIDGSDLINQVRDMRSAMTTQSVATSYGFDINNPQRYMSASGIREAYKDQHCQNDATELDVALGMCPSVTTEESSDSTIQDFSGKPHSVVPNDQNANVYLNNPTLSPKQIESSQRFTLLVADAHPSGQVMANGMVKNGDRIMTMYEWDRQRAIRSVAKSVISQLVGETTVLDPNSDQQKKLREWAENRAKNVVGYKPDKNGSYFPNGVSDYAFNELMVRGYANDINQEVLGTAQNTSATLKDIRQLLQFLIVLEWKRYNQGRDQNMISASMQSLQADQEQRNNPITKDQ